MILYVVAVRDSATDAFGRPFFVVAPGQAMRSFQDECNRDAADNELSRHPDDFELYQLATFNDASGEFASSPPVLLMRGKDARRPREAS